ncbi:hypothetical protein GCM10009839_93610 [Catenulispora yoronensis]|uniref:DUF1918 domain-containing protein n=1 Tax=Catenulispora yoronensis TaxID=450799 RepID=A0ABN2VNA0_9ACTN
MKAQAGDRLRFRSAVSGHCGAEILMVRGREHGGPPYPVRFDGGRVALVVPRPDAVPEPVPLAELDDEAAPSR